MPSDIFIENMVEFITNAKALNHIDISGMNLCRDHDPSKFIYLDEIEGIRNANSPILLLASALSSCNYLIGIHMSDNGLRFDDEVFMDVLD